MSGFGIVVILFVVCLAGFSWWGARPRAQGKFAKPESEIGEISDEALNEDLGIDAEPSPRDHNNAMSDTARNYVVDPLDSWEVDPLQFGVMDKFGSSESSCSSSDPHN